MKLNISKILFSSIFCNIAVCSYGVPLGATATTADFGQDTIKLSELSVTAIKQSDNLSNEAISATTIGKRDIEKLNIVDAKNASSIIPNFFIPDYGSRITSSIYVRGIGARIDQPAVGLNIDNVPIMNKDNYDFDILDIERIEMLRGAQGTLFGRNTIGGLINIYTLSPFNYQGFRFMGSYTTANSYRVGASYYAKLNEKFGLSANAYFNSTDGFFTNQYNGKKCDWEHQGSSRIKLQWQPAQNLSVANVASLSLVKQGGYPYEYIKTGEVCYNDTCFYRRTSVTDGLTVGLTLDNISMSSITSYQYLKDNMTLDQDFLPLSYFTLTQAKAEHAITQDFIIKNLTSNRYNWLCGLFGFYKHTDMDAPVTFLDYGIDKLIEANANRANEQYPIRWDTRQFLLGSNFNTSNYGLALYHQSTYELGDWKFTAGIRIDYEHVALSYLSQCNTGYNVFDNYAPQLPGGIKHDISSPEWWNGLPVYTHKDVVINDPGNMSKSFWQILPKFSVTYRLRTKSPSHIYVSAAKGYKAGGFNTQMFSDVLQQRIINSMGIGSTYKVADIITYKPEQSWTFETGSHTEWLNSTLSTDISLFYISCTDQQLTVFPDGNTTGRIMTNAGKTRNWGVEFALKAYPTKELELNLSYGYTNARFVKFDNGKEDFSGKTIPYAPQNTIFASANYTITTNKEWLQRVVIGANVRGTGKIYWNEANDVVQNLYALLGASIRFEQRNISLDIWGENLTDTAYRTFYFVSIGNAFLQRGKSRQIGATLRVRI